MKCREYIFKLTSGQLEDADMLVRMQAAQHRLICGHCRAFTRNDARLDQIMADYQAHTGQPEAAGSDPAQDERGPS